MKKLSSEQAAQVLSQVGPALRALSEENTSLKEKLAFHEKSARVEKIASQMRDKNLSPDTPYSDMVSQLMSSGDLDVVEKAIEISAPQIKLAALSDHSGNPSDAKSAFEAAILGD